MLVNKVLVCKYNEKQSFSMNQPLKKGEVNCLQRIVWKENREGWLFVKNYFTALSCCISATIRFEFSFKGELAKSTIFSKEANRIFMV